MSKHTSSPVVIGTGLIALDLVVSADRSVPIKDWAGGTCGNVLAILGSLDWSAFPIARLNTDVASLRVAQDLEQWGVNLEFSSQAPTTDIPMIVQKINHGQDGGKSHSFSWKCPTCNAWLPPYKAVTGKSINDILSQLPTADVFFFDRVSRGALILAEDAKKNGALVFFEPSATSTEKQFVEALNLADVVKYSEERFPEKICAKSALLEIQTQGQKGLLVNSRLPNAKTQGWEKLDAISADQIVDTAGCGDWLTAGFLSKIGAGGVKKFEKIQAKSLSAALRFGQALSAWNCKFEGARGGMYAEEQINISYLSGKRTKKERIRISPSKTKNDKHPTAVPCPVCH